MGLKFKGCEHLAYENNYSQCEKVQIEDHACWERLFAEGEMPRFVQFCKKRGRLNSHNSCIGYCNRACGDYKETEHDVD